ncbi:hypothetical protein BHE74_00033750 [Ensete ventricosum]|nr:hypothetical protein GW17_00028915 [Ensete ventricosum]RWW59328.1 hypothetical protein BHE74_00033750 [Ensete ventricosum]RZS20639.1 hypothetical protein BHM03_00053170 [Ensete ventricosum]
MRLNRVELFYAFATRTTRRRGDQPRLAPMQGRPPTAKPATRGNRLQPRPLVRGRPTTAKTPLQGQPPASMAGAYGRRQHPQPGHRWRLSAARPQGVAPWPGLPLARAAASRGSARARRQGGKERASASF